MSKAYQYNDQIRLQSPILQNNEMNPPNITGNFDVSMATNDPSVLLLSGNATTMSMKGNSLFQYGDHPQGIHSIRINMIGAPVQTLNLCCWIATLVLGSIFVFPLFFICCNWWKRYTWQIYDVETKGYEGVANIIKNSDVSEIYLTVQDNNFNSTKAKILIQALSKTKIYNFYFNNVARNFDTEGKNESDFEEYMRPIQSYATNSQISWGRKFVRG